MTQGSKEEAGGEAETGEEATLAARTAGSGPVAALPSHRDIVLWREVIHKLIFCLHCPPACVYRGRIHEHEHEHSISLRFLGIILGILGLEVSVYNVYIHYKPTSNQGGGGSKIR
jgi:hypothetical protein